jgi:nucleoside-diphosphate-sugar epimerase
MSTVLVTGANGFVGMHLCKHLNDKGFTVRRAVRSHVTELQPVGSSEVVVGDIDSNTDWTAALSDVDYVVHLAARVHVLSESSTDPLTAFRKVNTLGTARLAEQAVEAGVRRFIYVSSGKAAADETTSPQLESDQPQPTDPYGQSKFEGEELLLRKGSTERIQPVVIRPPLVYGPQVGANFLRLLNVVKRGVPLPLSGVRNKRSLVSVYNLCEFITHCLSHPAAAGNVFNVSDGCDVSTSELLNAIGSSMNRRARLFYVPPVFLRLMFQSIGRASDFNRLFGSLQLSIDKAQRLLGWTPPVSMDEGLRMTVDWYSQQSSVDSEGSQ